MFLLVQTLQGFWKMDERTVSAALSFLGAIKRLTNYSAGSQQTEFSTQGADLLFFSVFKK